MICKICGKEYYSLGHHIKNSHKMSLKEYYDKFNPTIDKTCPICGKEKQFSGRLTTGYLKTCGNKKCIDILRTQSTTDTMLKRYGKVGYNNREKAKETFQRKYGKDNYISTDNFINKSKNTKLKKYGNSRYTNPSKIWDTRKKNRDIFAKENNCTAVDDLVKEYGQGWLKGLEIEFLYFKKRPYIKNEDIHKIEEYVNKNHNVLYSKIEKELVDFIKDIYNGTIVENIKRIIYPYELDIFIPDKQLAVEFNGIHWHSTKIKPKNYHLEKSKLCREKGIRLIHIYEFEDLEYQKQLLKKLIIDEVDNYPKRDFNKNNLLKRIPNPEIIYQDDHHIIYGAGKLY